MALVPHPTSWWWQERDGVEKYTTNVASHLAFGLLSGGLWDGLVVMGYDHDHYFYQNLWFHVLNEGYRMTPVAELDGGLEPGTRFFYGAMRTYAHVGPETEHGRRWCDAVQSGPHLRDAPARSSWPGVDDRYEVGDVVPADGAAPHAPYPGLRLRGPGRLPHLPRSSSATAVSTASGICGTSVPRKLEEEVTLGESESAWYVLKAYGRNSDRSPEALDVMAVCDGIVDGRADVAAAEGERRRPDQPLLLPSSRAPATRRLSSPRVRLTVVGPGDRGAGGEGEVQVQLLGRTVETHDLSGGRVELTMPVNAVLRASTCRATRPCAAPFTSTTSPYRDLIERLASGALVRPLRRARADAAGAGPVGGVSPRRGATGPAADVEWTIPLKPERERTGSGSASRGCFD